MVELCLFAPYNEHVELLADFTDWNPVDMTRGADGWWRSSHELKDGQYHYRFRVKSLSYFCHGEMKDVFDPYALQITPTDPENAVLSIRNGRRTWVEYEWKHDQTPLPKNEELVIYELHVGDFAGKAKRAGTFNDVIPRLDYIAGLGVTAVELLPVKEFPGRTWGYSLRSLFAVENSYGPPEDLCRLVDECHARGIRVLIDGVYNHADMESPLTKIDYEYWFYKDNPDPPELHWGPKFNYEKYDETLKIFPARKYVWESIDFWIEKFHIDGIRFDATRAIRNFDMLKEMTDLAFKKIDGIKPFFTVAEHVAEDPAITGYPEGPMVAAWHFSLAAHLRAMLIGKENDGQSPDDFDGLLKKLDPRTNGYTHGSRYVNYLVSHDHDRIMHQLGDQGKFFDEAAFRRVKLGIGLLATLPGLPMLWMGQEFGFASNKSLDPRPLDWKLLENELNAGLAAHVAAVMKLRRDTDALRNNDAFEIVMADAGRKVFAYKRWTDAGGMVVVAVNLKDDDAGAVAIEGHGLEDGDWHEFVNNYDLKVEGGRLADTLGPSELKIFIKA